MRDILKGLGIFQLIQAGLIRHLTFDHPGKSCRQLLCFGHGLTLNQINHDIGAGLRDGASIPHKSRVFDNAVLHPQFQSNLVAAGGVHPFQHMGSMSHLMFVRLRTAVLRNNLCINLFKLHNPATTSLS